MATCLLNQLQGGIFFSGILRNRLDASVGDVHVEEDGVREQGGDGVGKDEIRARRLSNETQRHDGLGDAGLDPYKCREADGKDDERGNDKWMRPCNLSVVVLSHLD